MDHGINPNLVRTWISQYQCEHGQAGVAGLTSEVVSQDQAEISAVAPSEEPAFVQGAGQISRDVPAEYSPAQWRSPGGWPDVR
jgi:transposase-like protein